MEQRISLPEPNFDPSKAFKKNKEILQPVGNNFSGEKSNQSPKKDYIDKTNSQVPMFSEDLECSKASESSWFNQDKVKELQIKLTPLKHASRNGEKKETVGLKENSPELEDQIEEHPMASNIMDIINQENNKVGIGRGEIETKKSGIEAKKKESEKKKNQKSIIQNNEDFSNSLHNLKETSKNNPSPKNSNIKNLLQKITQKTKQNSRSSLTKLSAKSNQFRQRSPLISKIKFLKKPSQLQSAKKKINLNQSSTIQTSRQNNFSSSESSSSDSGSSRSSSNSSNSSGSSSGSSFSSV